MNDQDRFESEMRGWLREQAPRQAPEGLLARGLVAVRHTSQHRAWLTDLATLRSVRLIAAGAVVVAGMLAAVVLLDIFPRGGQPVGPSTAAIASSSPSSAAPWTSLRWSAPVPLPDGGIVSDMTRWRDGYVAVGQVVADKVVGGLFKSVDGLHWTHLDTGKTFPGDPPVRIVASAGRLVAMGNPPEPTCGREGEGAVCKPSGPAPLWVSDDARTWRRVDAAPFAGTSPSRVAARSDGFVVVGETFGGKAAIWHSGDGTTWARVALPPSFDHAILMNVASIPGGYLAIGRDGAPDVDVPGGAAYNPGIGLPAAWWSADGLNWIAASVEGERAPGAQLLDVMAGSDGLLAIGSDSTDPQASARTAAGWVSADGRAWTRIDAAAFAIRPYGSIAGSNGAQIVTIGPKLVGARYDADTLGAWLSTNGIQWRSLPILGNAADLPGGDVSSLTKAHIDQVLVVGDGLIVLGQSGGLGEIAWWVDASGG
jgi:hypothetical protein